MTGVGYQVIMLVAWRLDTTYRQVGVERVMTSGKPMWW